jgi:hypothetical protein
MGYVKAALLAFVAAIALGAGLGAYWFVRAGAVNPADRATVYAASIAEAMNCAAFFVLLFVPLSVILVFVDRWRRRRSPPREAR